MLCLMPLFHGFTKFLLSLTNTDLKNIAAILPLWIGAYVGWQGLRAWKIKLKGHENFNLAKSTLILIHKYKEALFNVRHPWMWPFEYPIFTHEELTNITPKQKSYRETLYAYQKRWEKVSEIKPLLCEKLLEAEVVWEPTLRNIIEKLFKLEFKLWRALSTYVELKNPETQNEGIKTDRDLIFDTQNEQDVFRNDFNEIIKEAEEYLKPRLKL